MNRRRFLRVSVGGFVMASAGLSGCLGSDDEEPPPREAKVFDDVSIEGERMTIELVSDPEVQSTKDNVDDDAVVGAAVLSSLLPIGTARAGSRSSGSGSGTSGATGRGSGGHADAPTNERTGWAIYGGHSHGHHHEREDEATTYRANIAKLGVAYVGSNATYQRKSPGPDWGSGNWDEEVSDPGSNGPFEVHLATLTNDAVPSMITGTDADAGSGAVTASDDEPSSDPESNAMAAPENGTEAENGSTGSSNETGDNETNSLGTLESASADEGWYRVGTHLESPSGAVDFGWEAADFKLERDSSDGLTVDEAWHVRPRL